MTESEIVDVAMAIIRERGVDGLSMRRLSDDLGVALGATYGHVASKDALLVLVTKKLYSEIELPPAEIDYVSWLREVVVRFWDVVSEYPGIATYLVRHFDELAPTFITEAAQESLMAGGLTFERASRARRALMMYCAGSLFFDLPQTAIPTSTNSRRDDFTAGLEVILDGLRTERDATSRSAARRG